jgi:hypothetical protein
MAKITIMGKSFTFDESFFEMNFTLICMIIGGVIGGIYKPNSFAFSFIGFVAIASILGFTIGFIVSNLLIWAVKELKKKLTNSN